MYDGRLLVADRPSRTPPLAASPRLTTRASVGAGPLLGAPRRGPVRRRCRRAGSVDHQLLDPRHAAVGVQRRVDGGGEVPDGRRHRPRPRAAGCRGGSSTSSSERSKRSGSTVKDVANACASVSNAGASARPASRTSTGDASAPMPVVSAFVADQVDEFFVASGDQRGRRSRAAARRLVLDVCPDAVETLDRADGIVAYATGPRAMKDLWAGVGAAPAPTSTCSSPTAPSSTTRPGSSRAPASGSATSSCAPSPTSPDPRCAPCSNVPSPATSPTAA